MPRDASLTDFAPPDGSADEPSEETVADPTSNGAADPTADESGDLTADGPDDASPGPRASGDDGEGAGGEPAPARVTYAWTPEGAACAACGERTTRRWRLGDDLVCPDCKTW